MTNKQERNQDQKNNRPHKQIKQNKHTKWTSTQAGGQTNNQTSKRKQSNGQTNKHDKQINHNTTEQSTK